MEEPQSLYDSCLKIAPQRDEAPDEVIGRPKAPFLVLLQIIGSLIGCDRLTGNQPATG